MVTVRSEVAKSQKEARVARIAVVNTLHFRWLVPSLDVPTWGGLFHEVAIRKRRSAVPGTRHRSCRDSRTGSIVSLRSHVVFVTMTGRVKVQGDLRSITLGVVSSLAATTLSTALGIVWKATTSLSTYQVGLIALLGAWSPFSFIVYWHYFRDLPRRNFQFAVVAWTLASVATGIISGSIARAV